MLTVYAGCARCVLAVHAVLDATPERWQDERGGGRGGARQHARCGGRAAPGDARKAWDTEVVTPCDYPGIIPRAISFQAWTGDD